MTQTDRRPAGLDQRTADLRLYLRELFDGTTGYVHAATLDRRAAEGIGWQPLRGIREGEGRIPDDRPALLDGLAEALVLESDLGVDVFTCPYPLMGARVRAAGRATTRRHAHADIDGPVDLERARALGAWAVASGSTAADGTPHGHIYVRMTESVPEHAHTALCQALGQMIGGEHHDTGKVNDNDVLRPPGTLNHKRDPQPVAWLIRPDDLTVRTWEPEALARELGVQWPIPDPGEGPEPAEAVGPTGVGREALEPVPLAEGLAARRVDGLVRMVAEAERGAGNDALNRAAGVCAALCATAGEGLDPVEVRERLVQAYRDRPSEEPRRQREQTARATVRSGWRWGTAHPAEARADRGPRAAAEVAEEQTTLTTTEPEAVEPDDAFLREVAAEVRRLRIRDAAAEVLRGDQVDASPSRLIQPGGSLILDTPEHPVPIWGARGQVLMAHGEALLIVGPSGVGKSTLAQQFMLGRCGLERFAELLDQTVSPGEGRVLYLAMDRPAQALRSLRRMVSESERALLDERLGIWQGPPPAKLTEHPEVLLRMCREAGADTVVIDSLKDTGSVVDDEGGTGWNTARQTVLAEGVEVLELHHQRKGGTLEGLDDVYGSTWLTAGAGSVLAMIGRAGDPVVKVRHLKQPAEEVGPLNVEHDHVAGRSRVVLTADLVSMAGRLDGVSAVQAAHALFSADKPDANQKARARRRLEALAREGRVRVVDEGDAANGRPKRWGAAR